MFCVRERHTEQGVVNSVVMIDLNDEDSTRIPQEVAAGYDFYSSLAISPDSQHLCFLAWNHPRMPWDAAELHVAAITPEGRLAQVQYKVAGGDAESCACPAWGPDGTLYFVSDRSEGFWNIHRWKQGRVEVVCQMQAEFCQAQWRVGDRPFSFCGTGSDYDIICAYQQRCTSSLARLDPRTGSLTEIPTRLTPTSPLNVWVAGKYCYFIGGCPSSLPCIVKADLDYPGLSQILQRSSEVEIHDNFISMPEDIEFTTGSGDVCNMFFYPPKNALYKAAEGELPPLLVKAHGGPTSSTSPLLNLEVQFWTSHGFAVADVNYSGSTGYGRSFRERLYGHWGVKDVEDCVAAATHLVAQGKVDGKRLVTKGSSAGGLVTLSALTFHSVFRAGASYYGISDIETLAADTHKFESRYIDQLIGPYPAEQHKYQERSPINFTERLSCPVILFQGSDDKIVPPSQAEKFVEVLQQKGIPVAYQLFENEGHGFQQASTIKRTLTAELYFYSKVLGFELGQETEPIHIHNFPQPAPPSA